MSIMFLKLSISNFTNRIIYCYQNGVEMKTADFDGDDIRIIQNLFETTAYIEENGLLPNRVSVGLEQELKKFMSVVDESDLRFAALCDLSNDVYWVIMVIYYFAVLYFELVNAENGISSDESFEFHIGYEFCMKHEEELNNLAKRLYNRLYNKGIADNETGKVKQELPEELDTEKAKELFEKISYCEIDGNLYTWNGTPSLFGYFVDKTSSFLGIRASNNNIPWKKYQMAFQISDSNLSTARSAVNDYKNKGLSEPDGFYEIKKLCDK